MRPDLLGERLIEDAIGSNKALLDGLAASDLSERHIQNTFVVLARISQYNDEAREWIKEFHEVIRLKQDATRIIFDVIRSEHLGGPRFISAREYLTELINENATTPDNRSSGPRLR